MGIKFGSVTTGIIADGLVFNMDAANRASYIPDSTSTRNTLDLTQTGSFSSNPIFVSGNGWAFDGVDDDIENQFGSEVQQTGWTIGVWFKGIDGDTSTQYVLNYGNGSNWDNSFNFDLNDGAGVFIYWQSSGGNRATYGSDGEYCDGTVKNFQFTMSKTGVNKLYVDGVEVSAASTAGTQLGTLGNTTHKVFLGKRGNGTPYYFEGNIYSAKIYNRSLEAWEVLHNYNALKSRYT